MTEGHESTGPRASEAAVAARLDCLRCGAEVTPVGVHNFRVGGSGGGMTAVLGGFAEMSERLVDIELLVCTVCRHIEMRATDSWFPR